MGVLDEEGEANPEMLTLVRSSADHMLNLIRDVPAVSAIESGRLNLRMEPVDLATLAHDVVRSFYKAAALKKEAHLTVRPLIDHQSWFQLSRVCDPCPPLGYPPYFFRHCSKQQSYGE